MGHKSHIKAQRRAQKIAQVQRERDIAEVFDNAVFPPVELYYHEPIVKTFESQHNYGFIGEYNIVDFEFDKSLNLRPQFDKGMWLFWEDGLADDPDCKHWIHIPIVDDELPNRYRYDCYYYSPHDANCCGCMYLRLWVTDAGYTFSSIEASDISNLDDAMYAGSILLETLARLNTSNIELVDVPPNPRLSAISEREFGYPLTTYKVLKVNTGHKEYYGRDKDTGLRDFDPRRMHVVRGHHAEYGTNGRKLLFGKYQRKIWIPAHVRGNEELGIVVKDYEVVDDPTA